MKSGEIEQGLVVARFQSGCQLEMLEAFERRFRIFFDHGALEEALPDCELEGPTIRKFVGPAGDQFFTV